MVTFLDRFEDEDENELPDLPHVSGVSNLYMLKKGDPRLPVDFSMMESSSDKPNSPAMIYIVDDDPDLRAASASHELAHFKLKHHQTPQGGQLSQIVEELQAVNLQVLQMMAVDEWTPKVRWDTIECLATYGASDDRAGHLAWAAGQVDLAEQAARRTLKKEGLL